MTRAGYRLLLALFASVLIGGLVAAAPAPSELGVAPTMPCEEWFARPHATDFVRLEGCTIDLWTNSYDERFDRRGIEAAIVQVRPPGWQPGEDVASDRTQLLWRTTDPELLAWIDRGRRAGDDAAYLRFTERHAAELLRVSSVHGSIALAPRAPEWSEHVQLHGETVVERPWVADGSTRSPALRAAGLLALILALFAIVMVVLMQRRWDRRRAALLGVSAGPRRF